MSLASHPAYFTAATPSHQSPPSTPVSSWLERIKDGSFRHHVSKRSKYITNRLNRISPATRRRVLILFIVGTIFMMSIGLARAASASLQLDESEGLTHRKLAEALRRQAVNTTRPDMIVYPSFPKRPDVFPKPDADHLHGLIGQGDWSPKKLSFKMTLEDKRKAHEGYCFNTRVSASLALDRKVPEFNSNKCRQEKYVDLPAADVVIVFHNEDLSVLLRSIHSILNRTPPTLLNKIILVNDDSNKTSHPWLFEDLPPMLEHLPKTELVHLTSRRGLMMARMEGTYRSNAEVVVYLDSHIECTSRWLEPMLKEIKEHPKRMVTPMIHSIDADNFEFESGAVGVVGFTWTLGQSHPSRPTDHYTPIISPVMAGGLFATNRQWFLDLGGYDPEMKLYGGEEMEIGFKVWQCGGELYNLPCSRVGHVFRTDKFWKGQVYKVPMAEIIRNKLRTVEVWLDEFKPIAKMAMSKLEPGYTLGPLEEVLAIREKHQCKPFRWYLENIYPDLWVPDLDTFTTGALMNPSTRACLDTMGRNHGEMGLYPCHGQHGSQALIFSNKTGEIRTAASAFKNCLQRRKNEIQMLDCFSVSEFHFYPVENVPQVRVVGAETYSDVGLMKLKEECLLGRRDDGGHLSLDFAQCDPHDVQQHWAWGE